MDRGFECPDELLVSFQPSLAKKMLCVLEKMLFFQQVEGPVVDLQIIDEDDERTFDNGKVEDLQIGGLIQMDGLTQPPTQEENVKDHQRESAQNRLSKGTALLQRFEAGSDKGAQGNGEVDARTPMLQQARDAIETAIEEPSCPTSYAVTRVDVLGTSTTSVDLRTAIGNRARLFSLTLPTMECRKVCTDLKVLNALRPASNHETTSNSVDEERERERSI